MTIKDQKCRVKFTIKMYQLQCSFSAFIFTDNLKNSSKQCLQMYIIIVIRYYNYIRNDRLYFRKRNTITNTTIRNTIYKFNKLVSDLDIHANTPKS